MYKHLKLLVLILVIIICKEDYSQLSDNEKLKLRTEQTKKK